MGTEISLQRGQGAELGPFRGSSDEPTKPQKLRMCSKFLVIFSIGLYGVKMKNKNIVAKQHAFHNILPRLPRRIDAMLIYDA